jgi:hypothetical protein
MTPDKRFDTRPKEKSKHTATVRAHIRKLPTGESVLVKTYERRLNMSSAKVHVKVAEEHFNNVMSDARMDKNILIGKGIHVEEVGGKPLVTIDTVSTDPSVSYGEMMRELRYYFPKAKNLEGLGKTKDGRTKMRFTLEGGLGTLQTSVPTKVIVMQDRPVPEWFK